MHIIAILCANYSAKANDNKANENIFLLLMLL